MEYAVCLGEMVKVGMELTDIQQGMRVVPVFATGFECLVRAKEEDEGEAVAFVLFADMCQTGVDTPAINRIVYLCAIGSDIMHSCLGNLTSKTEMASHVVVRFAKLVVCEETTERVVECADSLLKRCGIIVENMLVLIKTISNSDSSMCLVPTSGVATGNEEQAEE